MSERTQPESDAFETMFSTARADDPLALFEAEAASVATDGASPSPIAHGEPQLSLDRVLERLSYVSWAEGVAIVDAVCAQLTATTRGAERIPELSQISLTAEGSIVIAPSGANGPAGPALARILHALTAHGAMPAPLRLFVSKWASFEEAHTIADFIKELAYFVRPGGAALIRAVYERARAAASASPPQTPPQPTKAAPPREHPQRVAGRRRTLHIVVAAILVAGALASALTWRAVSSGSGSVSAVTVASVLPSIAAGARHILALAGQRTGTPSPSATNTAATEPTVSPSGPAPARANVIARRRPANPVGAVQTGAVAARPSSGAGGALAGATTVDTSLPPIAPSSSIEEVAETPIYSSADSDVTPPEIRHPQLPPPFLSGVQADVNTIELIVTEAGNVERVRLLSPPRRMADMMLLSGAKTWQFEPASRAGQSVRYRLLLSWTATP
jgi:hypothetical protein